MHNIIDNCPHHGLIPLAPPDAIFVYPFVWGTYLLAAFVLYRAIVRGTKPTFLPGRGLLANHDVYLLIALFLIFWALESLGHVAEPFLAYPRIGVMLPLPESLPSWIHSAPAPRGQLKTCIECCTSNPDFNAGIPLAVVLMEAMLSYAALKTTQALKLPFMVRPFVGALALVILDSYADPVFATTFSCSSNYVGEGIGLWFWYIPYGDPSFANWYGIPLYNYAAWFAGPLLAIAFAYWFSVTTSLIVNLFTTKERPRPDQRFSLLILIAIVIFSKIWVKLFNPIEGIDIAFQYQIFFSFYLITVLGVIATTPSVSVDNPPQWSVLAIVAFYMAYVSVALLYAPFEHPMPWYLVAALCGLVIVFFLLPYLGAIFKSPRGS